MPREFTADERKKLPSEIRAVGAAARIVAADDQPGDDGKPKLATFAGNAYTGVPMEPGGWWGSIICDLAGVRVPMQHRPVLRQHDDNRIVGHTTDVKVTDAGVEIAGVFSGRPELVEDVTALAKNGFQWQLSIGAVPVRTEFLEVGESTEVNGRTVYGPLTISRETELKEISFVPLGADGNTSVAVSASRGRGAMFKAMLLAAKKANNVKAGKYSDGDIDKMSEDEAKAALKEAMDEHGEPDGDEKEKKAKAKAEDDEDETKEAKAAARRVAARRKQEADEDRRVEEIRAKAKGHPKIVAKAIEEGWTVEKAELEALRASRPGPGVGGPHIHIPGQPEMSEAVVEAAIFQAASPTEFRLFDKSFYAASGDRGPVPDRLARRVQAELAQRYPDQVQQAAHTLFQGRIGLQQVLTASARIAGGYTGPERISGDNHGAEVLRLAAGQAGFRAEGASNYSLGNLLANVLNKTMLGGYLFVEQAWREFAGIRSVNDFKATKAVNLFGDFVFEQVGPTGELKSASLADQAFANQADQYGRIMTIDRKAIINDDLGALTTVPMLMGRGAALKLNKSFWATFLSPGNADDGNAFWTNTAGTHGTAPAGQRTAGANLQTGGGTALSSDSLKSAEVLFNRQVDPAGEPLGVDPEILLHPPELAVTARELMNGQFLLATTGTNKQPNTNVWVGKFKPVMSRYLSNAAYTGFSLTAWYLLANPGLYPVIECAFLNGVDTPTVQQAGIDYQFDKLGISIRGVFDFGVNMQQFRGGVRSAGA